MNAQAFNIDVVGIERFTVLFRKQGKPDLFKEYAPTGVTVEILLPAVSAAMHFDELSVYRSHSDIGEMLGEMDWGTRQIFNDSIRNHIVVNCLEEYIKLKEKTVQYDEFWIEEWLMR